MAQVLGLILGKLKCGRKHESHLGIDQTLKIDLQTFKSIYNEPAIKTEANQSKLYQFGENFDEGVYLN